MDIDAVLAQLRSQREQLTEAITVLQRIASGSGQKRRGRPPKWLSASQSSPDGQKPRMKRKTMSAAARAKIAEAQRKRWAEKRKASNSAH